MTDEAMDRFTREDLRAVIADFGGRFAGRPGNSHARGISGRFGAREVEANPVGCPGRDARTEEVLILCPDGTVQHHRRRQDRPIPGVPCLDTREGLLANRHVHRFFEWVNDRLELVQHRQRNRRIDAALLKQIGKVATRILEALRRREELHRIDMGQYELTHRRAQDEPNQDVGVNNDRSGSTHACPARAALNSATTSSGWTPCLVNSSSNACAADLSEAISASRSVGVGMNQPTVTP